VGDLSTKANSVQNLKFCMLVPSLDIHSTYRLSDTGLYAQDISNRPTSLALTDVE
jgi:hypothetical protein